MTIPEYGSLMIRFLLLALLILSPACEKDKAPAKSRTATVDLGDVVGTLQLPSADNRKKITGIMDSLQPGGSAMLLSQVPAMLAKASGMSLAAADLSKPVSVVFLNPNKYPDPFAVLVHVDDLKKLEAAAKQADRVVVESDGLALVGAGPVVEAARGFAFDSLASPSNSIVAIAYPAPLNAIYKKEITQRIDSMARTLEAGNGQGNEFAVIMKLYHKALGALAEQSDRIELTVESQGATPSFLFKLFPVKGTTMAAFVDAQEATQHQLLAKLPATDRHGIVFSGLMHAGAARKAVVDFGVEVMKAMYAIEDFSKLAAQMGPWFDAFDGRVAMTMSMNMDPSEGDVGTAMNYLMGSSDTKAMRKGWHEMFDILAKGSWKSQESLMMGMKTKVQINKNVFQADGVEVDHYQTTMDLESLPAEQRTAIESMGMVEQNVYFAAFDNLAAMTSDKDGKSSMTSMVVAARGKQGGFQIPAGLAKVLDASKARKESLAMSMDIGSLASGGTPSSIPFKTLVMGMGKDEGALVVRFAAGL
jgi:hypothetical protein